MRLRLLFFPLMLIISVAIVLLAIVPQWEKIKTGRTELATKQKNLSDITTKQENIGKLESYIKTNSADVEFVKAYLPLVRNEERIIDGVNYLATNSGMALGNVDVEKVKSALPEMQEGTGLDVPVMGSASVEQGVDPTQTDPAAVVPSKPRVQLTKATINASGNYDAVMVFLTNLYKMEFFNNIESVDISTNKKDETAQTEQAETAEPQGSEILSAEIVMNFGFLQAVSVPAESGYANSLFLKSAYDTSAVSELKEFISKKIPALEVSGGGKANPFAL